MRGMREVASTLMYSDPVHRKQQQEEDELAGVEEQQPEGLHVRSFMSIPTPHGQQHVAVHW